MQDISFYRVYIFDENDVCIRQEDFSTEHEADYYMETYPDYDVRGHMYSMNEKGEKIQLLTIMNKPNLWQ